MEYTLNNSLSSQLPCQPPYSCLNEMPKCITVMYLHIDSRNELSEFIYHMNHNNYMTLWIPHMKYHRNSGYQPS